ncbi:protease inhibitor I42 family protein [Chromobacterium sp. Beijing]|uniref:protease inhibitor I42 family protein n=1 Tax=Chromobacterium sp. Beijing TaxID=2735795 RepID=UPI00351D815F
MFLSSSHKPSDKCGVVNNEGVPPVGCGRFTSYIFKALEKGTGTVRFEYGQQWSKGVKKVITVKVTVK